MVTPMKNAHCNLALLVVPTILSVFFAAQVYAETLNGRVVKVADGDTVTVLDASRQQHKIRLMGIDAPEKKMSYGNRSKQSLSDLVFDRQVQVEYSKKDKYGRTVGKIIVGGVDANLAQIKAGMAWHYKQYQREQTVEDRDLYARTEEDARAYKRGLWKDADPVPPWDWRKQQRNKD
jgi:endonuclease YncB( thermonuclease family)